MDNDDAQASHELKLVEAPSPDLSLDAETSCRSAEPEAGVVTETALLVTQGKHRFYSLVLASDLLAATCTVDPRQDNPIDGFQRLLDKRRARDIANYIDTGFERRRARSSFPPSLARGCITIAPASCCAFATPRTRF